MWYIHYTAGSEVLNADKVVLGQDVLRALKVCPTYEDAANPHDFNL
jgi:hypothetical protein